MTTTVTNALATRDDGPNLPGRLDPTQIEAKIHYAQQLAHSGLLPEEYRGKPANLLYAIEYADMLGLHPLVAITGINVIKGKPSAGAALIAGMVRSAGHKLRTIRIPNGARTVIVRKDDPDFEHVFEFTMDDARTAGLLGNDNWKKRPAVMCEWRSISGCARLACSEALFGINYTPDELGARVNDDGTVVVTDARPQRQRPRTITEAVAQQQAPAATAALTPDNPIVDVEGELLEDGAPVPPAAYDPSQEPAGWGPA